MRKLLLASLGLLGLAAISGVSTPATAASVTDGLLLPVAAAAPAVEHAAPVRDRMTVAQDQSDARRHRRPRHHARRVLRR
jgi:hypothetical protein